MHRYEAQRLQRKVLECDCCGEDFDGGGLSIAFRAHYASVFEHGNLVEGDFCQTCTDKLFGPHLKTNKTSTLWEYPELEAQVERDLFDSLESKLQGIEGFFCVFRRIVQQATGEAAADHTGEDADA